MTPRLWTFLLALAVSAAAANITPEGALEAGLSSSTDFIVPAGPTLLTLQRTLADPPGRPGLFGARWRMNWEDRAPGSLLRIQRDARGIISGIEGPAGAAIRFRLDAAGHAVHAEASNGNVVDYTYSGDDLIAVSANGGPATRYAYDASGRLSRIDDPRTGAVQIAWDARGRVTTVRYADGTAERAEYDDTSGSVRLIGPTGSATTILQLTGGQRQQITDPLGNVTLIDFDRERRPVSITAPGGARASFYYDPSGRLTNADTAGYQTTYSYGAEGRMEAVRMPGAQQTFEYDQGGRLTGIRLGGGLIASYRYTPDGQVAAAREGASLEQSYTYHPNGQLKSVANPLGEVTQFTYDARGNLTAEINPAGAAWKRAYDAQNRLVSITEPWGATTRYEYDDAGHLVRMVEASGAARQYQYDARGRRVTETDSLGNLTRFQYDAAGRLSRVTSPFGSAAFTYDAAGRLVEESGGLMASHRRVYDAAGRLMSERRPEGLEVTYRRDAAGRVTAMEDSVGRKQQWQYDAQLRPAAATDALGSTTRIEYDPFGRVIAETDPLGRTREFGRAFNGDILASVEPNGDQAGFSYDGAGRLTSARRPSGERTTYSYDVLSNLIATQDPLGRRSRRTYDIAGRLATSTDAMDRVTRYTHDAMARVSEKTLASGKRIAYRYDAAGRLLEADDGAFPVRYTFNAADSITRIDYPAIRKAVVYQYNTDGLRTSVTDPAGRVVRYEYGPTKTLTAIVLPDERRIGITLDAAGGLASISYPNGITGTWQFDAAGRLIAVRHRDRQANDVATATYTYNAAGEPIARSSAQVTTRYTYDAASQLTSESSAGFARRYTYARGGNRASAEIDGKSIAYRYDAADQMLEAGEEKLDYDANGSLIRRTASAGATTYTYDDENRLTRIAGPSGTTEYGYAPTGERIWSKTPNGATRHFVYDGPNLLAEFDERMQPMALYVHAPGIDRPLAMIRGGETYFYHADRLGSILALSDSTGKLAAAYRYDAFGVLLHESNRALVNPFRFAAREYEPSGLYYFRARYYDPALGRFLSPDPKAPKRDQPLDLNPYLYARNNPVRFRDPSGLDAEPDWDPRRPMNEQSTEFLRWFYRLEGWKLQAAAEGKLTPKPGGGVELQLAQWEQLSYRMEQLASIRDELTRRGVRVPSSTPPAPSVEIPAPRSGTVSQSAGAPSAGAPSGESGGTGRVGNNLVDINEALQSGRWGNTGRVEAGPAGGGRWGNTGVAAAAPAQPAASGTNAVPRPTPMMGGDTIGGRVRPAGNTIAGPAPEATAGGGSARQVLGATAAMAGLDAVKVYACMQEGKSFAECSKPAVIGTAMGVAGAGVVALAPAAAPVVIVGGVGLAVLGTGREVIRANDARNARNQAIAEANRAEKDVRIGQKVNLIDIEGRLAALGARIAGFQSKVDELKNQANKAESALYEVRGAARAVSQGVTSLRQLDLQPLLNACNSIRQSQQLVALNLAEGRRKSALLARGLDYLRGVASNCTGRDPAGTVRQGLEDAKGLAAEMARLHTEAGKANRLLKEQITFLYNQQQSVGNAVSSVTWITRNADEAQRHLAEVQAACAAGKAAAGGLSPGISQSLEVEVTALRGSVPDTLPADLEARFATLRQRARNIKLPANTDFDRMLSEANMEAGRARRESEAARNYMGSLCVPGTAQDKAVADLGAEVYGTGIEIGAAQQYLQLASRCQAASRPPASSNTKTGGSSGSTAPPPSGNKPPAATDTPVCEIKVATDRTTGYYGESVLVTVTVTRGAEHQLTVARACEVPGCGAPILRHAGGGVYYDRLEFSLSASKFRQRYGANSRDGRATCEAFTPELQSFGVRR